MADLGQMHVYPAASDGSLVIPSGRGDGGYYVHPEYGMVQSTEVIIDEPALVLGDAEMPKKKRNWLLLAALAGGAYYLMG